MQEINLYDLLRFYAKNWLNLLSAIFIGAIIGLVYTGFIQTPLYKSEATMLVVGARTTQDATINNNYTELFKSRRVLETVIGQQGHSGDYQQLLSRTTASNDKNTDIIRVSIADPSSEKSQQLLSASLEVFKKEASSIYDSSADNVRIIDPASSPTQPHNVNILMQLALAVAATFFFMIIALFFTYDYRMSQAESVVKSNGKSTKKTATAKKTNKTPKKPVAKEPKTKAAVTVESRKKPLFLANITKLLVAGTDTSQPAKKAPKKD